jgi:hypothetical protein
MAKIALARTAVTRAAGERAEDDEKTIASYQSERLRLLSHGTPGSAGSDEGAGS